MIEEVQKFSKFWQQFLEEESEHKIGALYEELQKKLESINGDLSSLQNSEEELRKFVSFLCSHQSLLSL